MRNKILILILVVVLLVGGIGGYYWWQNNNQAGNPANEINPADLIVFEIKNEELSDFQKERFLANFDSAKDTINYNLSLGYDYNSDWNYSPLLAIATVQHGIGDDERAEKMWLWFTDAFLGNSISPANLGDLYKSFLIDNAKSEKYYLIALEREKHDFNIFYGLYELYRYRFEDSQKAIDILKDGLANNPGELNYVNTLVKYLLELGDREQASQVVEDFIADNPEQTGLRDKLKQHVLIVIASDRRERGNPVFKSTRSPRSLELPRDDSLFSTGSLASLGMTAYICHCERPEGAWQFRFTRSLKVMNYYYIYIITNKRHTVLYTGVTNNLIRRIWEHKNKIGDVSSFTKKYNVNKLVFYEQGYSILDAINREKQIKSWSRTKKEDLINSLNSEWKDLYIDMAG